MDNMRYARWHAIAAAVTIMVAYLWVTYPVTVFNIMWNIAWYGGWTVAIWLLVWPLVRDIIGSFHTDRYRTRRHYTRRTK